MVYKSFSSLITATSKLYNHSDQTLTELGELIVSPVLSHWLPVEYRNDFKVLSSLRLL